MHQVLTEKNAPTRERGRADTDRCNRAPGPKLPGQRSRFDSVLAGAGAGGVSFDGVSSTRCQVNCLLSYTLEWVACMKRSARHYLARSDLCRAQFVVYVTAAMAASNVKYRPGLPDANFFGQAVRAERCEVGLFAVWTLKGFHIYPLLKSTCHQAIVFVLGAKFEPENQANVVCIQWSMPSRQAVVGAPTDDCLGRTQNRSV
jgi:hypothetical protein